MPRLRLACSGRTCPSSRLQEGDLMKPGVTVAGLVEVHLIDSVPNRAMGSRAEL